MDAMIDASEAKRLLGCDDDALNGHINSGAIRAQRKGGKLMFLREDVDKLAAGGLVLNDDEEDGTIVLTGESDNLQIDLGKVDETSDTLLQSEPVAPAGPVKASTQTLSFGNELEVVSVEDQPSAGESADFDDSKQTMELAFTDVNTAENTAVDETEPGATGVDATAESVPSSASSTAATANPRGQRGSVRSNRARIEAAPVAGWVVGLLAAALLVMLIGAVPVQVIALWPGGERGHDGTTLRGVDDGLWAKLAGNFAGFSVEPNKARGGEGWSDIKAVDTQAAWRYQAYRGGSAEERESALIIDKVSEDGRTAFARKTGVQYTVREVKNGEATELVVDLAAQAAK